MKNTYDEKLLDAYMNGRFCNLQRGSTYYAFNREEHTGNCDDDESLPVRCGLDWNVDPLCCTVFQLHKEKPYIRVIKEISLYHAGEGDLLTERMCETIKATFPNNTYIAYPDATGKARNSSAAFSDLDIVRRAKFKVEVAHINPRVVNRVNAMNKQLSQNNILIDKSCTMLIGDLEKVVNKEGTRDIDKSNKKLTHMTDALGYAVTWLRPVIKPTIGVIDR